MKKSIYYYAPIILFVAPFFAAHAELSIRATDTSGNEKVNFAIGESIYISGACHLIDTVNKPRVFITPDQNWVSEETLSDVSGSIEIISGDVDGNIPTTLIWENPRAGSYDVVVDTNNNYKHENFEACIDGISTTGFTVDTPIPPPAPTPPPPQPTPLPPPTPQPTSLPQPAPQPTTPPSPSTKFSSGERVVVPELANVRQTAGGTLVGKQEKDAEGTITGGPTWVAKIAFWFWRVDFDTGTDGWVAESVITASPPTPPPPEEPAPEIKTQDQTPTPQSPTPPQPAQVYNQTAPGGLGGLSGAFIIGIALLLGLIVGSSIIARALRK